MDTLVETFKVGETTVELHWDSTPEYSNPRDCDGNVTEMRHWHRHYMLGDGEIEGRHREAMERGGFRLLNRYLRLCEGALIVVPLGLIDHSGLSMYVGGGSHWCDPGGWDSGTVGYAFITEDAITKWCGDDLMYRTEEWLEKAVRDEVDVYDQYLRGEVYGYVVKNGDGDEEESCWGFLGDIEYVRKEATDVAESVERERLVNQEPTDVAEVLAGLV